MNFTGDGVHAFVFADAFLNMSSCAKVSSPPRCVWAREGPLCRTARRAQNAIQTVHGRVLQGCDKHEDLISRSQCAFRFS